MGEIENLEIRRQAIIMELARLKQEAAQKGKAFDFNNFRHKLPGGSTRWAAEFTKLTDKAMHQRGQEYGGEVSELSFTKTRGEFFNIIDDVIQRLEKEDKIKLERLQSLNKIIEESMMGLTSPEEGKKASQQIEEALEPLYIELRLLGFSHYDLWQ